MADPRLVLAVDVGATNTRLTVRDADALERAWQPGLNVIKGPIIRDPDELVAWLGSQAAALLARVRGVLVSAGVAAPGSLDPDSGVVFRASNLRWTDVPLAPMLSARLGVPVALEDDAKAAALGEWRLGAGRGTDPFAYLTVSSGVGAGVVAGGRVHRGARGNAGEIGHLQVAAGGPRCGCGRRGDVESFLGGKALERRARRAWPTPRLPDGSPSPRDAASVFRAARRGDPQAAAIVDEATVALSVALAAFVATVEPERIAVGGAIGLGQPATVRRAARMARGRVLGESGRWLDVVPAGLGEESVLAGVTVLAGRLALG